MAVFNATGLPNQAVMSEYRQGKLSLFSTIQRASNPLKVQINIASGCYFSSKIVRRAATFQSGLLNSVNKFSPQRRSLPSLFTGFGVPVAVPVTVWYLLPLSIPLLTWEFKIQISLFQNH